MCGIQVTGMVQVLVLSMMRAWAASGESLLQPLERGRPSEEIFPDPMGSRWIHPAQTEVAGPKATNKFWANWVVASGSHEAIYPMPFVLKWGSWPAPELRVSRGESKDVYGDASNTGPERVRQYYTPFVSEFGLGALEEAETSGYSIVRETLFGINVRVRGPAGTNRQITFPIFSGMTYISGHFEGGFTPRITTERALVSISKIRDGTWSFRNNGGVEFRVYALRNSGDFVDSSFSFDDRGRLNKALEGWVRLAQVNNPGDADVLDLHASAILVDWALQVTKGKVQYQFAKQGSEAMPILHFAYGHHLKLLPSDQQLVQLTTRAPTKGQMTGVVGDKWSLHVDTSEAEHLDFLPTGEPDISRLEFLKAETLGALQWFKGGRNAKDTMLKGSYYFSGKGFQKLGTVCLLMEKFYGPEHNETKTCAELLASGFKCLCGHADAGDCRGSPQGLYYDAEWGGTPSREGFSNQGCEGAADFGNACYNDHHYHFGYFVVSASILVKLAPEYKSDSRLTAFIHTLIRDTANPSMDDLYFPAFRSFDWFDLHSWSRGIVSSADGKDQESTSEELNLLYGLHLWGSVLDKKPLQLLGDTMLSLCVITVQEFFLMEEGNLHHHQDFVKNHVTGIFFQNKADYNTWFGWREEFIHGIQMLPLSPVLQLSRKPSFCRQEWDDILSKLPLSLTDPWTSILLSGGLAIIEPSTAYERLKQMSPGLMDDGLTRVWALYWAAVQGQPRTKARSTTALPVSTPIAPFLPSATTSVSTPMVPFIPYSTSSTMSGGDHAASSGDLKIRNEPSAHTSTTSTSVVDIGALRGAKPHSEAHSHVCGERDFNVGLTLTAAVVSMVAVLAILGLLYMWCHTASRLKNTEEPYRSFTNSLRPSPNAACTAEILASSQECTAENCGNCNAAGKSSVKAEKFSDHESTVSGQIEASADGVAGSSQVHGKPVG
eukprot:TRINITY_DN35452_c0_g1_i1.p1 TRINITY_DN35452_c0_g1~~TRINITY_DN35452_c0_g1_i1.p1  ORF type:complete len:945 (+),score=122.89 TRINITY_DN35452_c0_g1_i1:104-2938(+)